MEWLQQSLHTLWNVYLFIYLIIYLFILFWFKRRHSAFLLTTHLLFMNQSSGKTAQAKVIPV